MMPSTMALISGCVSAGGSGSGSAFAARGLASVTGRDFVFGFDGVIVRSWERLIAGNPLNALPVPAMQDAAARGWYVRLLPGHSGSFFLAVNFAPMADCDYQHDKMIILNRRNNAIVSNAVTPQPLAVPGKRVAEATRVVGPGNAFTQISQNQPLSFRAKLAQVAHSRAVKFDSPDRHRHALARGPLF